MNGIECIQEMGLNKWGWSRVVMNLAICKGGLGFY